jgi:spermidine synthase
MRKKLFGKEWIFEKFLPGEPQTGLEGFAVKKTLYAKRSQYQMVEIVDTEGFDRMLFLDNLVQLSTKHEAVYHEMLVHPAMLSCLAPKKVLILGGGDGGALREVLKHSVTEVFLVDIDKDVIEASKKYLPSVSQHAFNDPRARVIVADGLKFISQHKEYFDCIIFDLSDPDNEVSSRMFERRFFEKAKRVLKQDGVFSAQTGYLTEDFGKKARMELQKSFPFFVVRRAYVGSFREGEQTFSLGSKKVNLAAISLATIRKRFERAKLATTYYSPEIHAASTVLPRYLMENI